MNRILSLVGRYRRYSAIKDIVSSNDLVLEVGSGNNPHRFSTVLLDKYICTTETHRTGSREIQHLHNRPFILADGGKLPFRDSAFNAIICRHVIEHMDDPISFVEELQRVGNSGYLEWPSIFTELIRGGFGAQDRIRDLFQPIRHSCLEALEHGSGSPGHRWFIVSLGDCLYLAAKSKELYPIYLMYGAYAKSRKQILERFLGIPVSWCTWIPGRILETVILSENVSDDAADSLEESYDLEEQVQYLRSRAVAGQTVSRRYKEILDIICCPICKTGYLDQSGDILKCSICSREYPIISGIPVLMTDAVELC